MEGTAEWSATRFEPEGDPKDWGFDSSTFLEELSSALNHWAMESAVPKVGTLDC